MLNIRRSMTKSRMFVVLGILVTVTFCVEVTFAETSSEEAMKQLQVALFDAVKALMEAHKAIGMLQAQDLPQPTPTSTPSPTPTPSQSPSQLKEQGIVLSCEKQEGDLTVKEEIYLPVNLTKWYANWNEFKGKGKEELDWTKLTMTLHWVLVRKPGDSPEHTLYHADEPALFQKDPATVCTAWSEFRMKYTPDSEPADSEMLKYDSVFQKHISNWNPKIDENVTAKESIETLERTISSPDFLRWLVLVDHPDGQKPQYILVALGYDTKIAPGPLDDIRAWCERCADPWGCCRWCNWYGFPTPPICWW